MPFSKYNPLVRYLNSQPKRHVTLSFKQVERILGFTLPESARKHASFWSNDISHAQARVWMMARWRTSGVSVPNEQVTFLADKKAEELGSELNDREILAFTMGSRRALNDAIRELSRTAVNPPNPDEFLFAGLTLASMEDPALIDVRMHPKPARGHRTQPGPGFIVSACGRDNDCIMRITVVDGLVQVQVALGEPLDTLTAWPRDRALTAVMFIALWETSGSWLMILPSPTDEPMWLLHASLAVRKYPSKDQCRRVYQWLKYEVDAFEDGLGKIVCRKKPVSGHRAMELAAKRLARHRRPPLSLVRSLTTSSNPMVTPLWLNALGDHL